MVKRLSGLIEYGIHNTPNSNVAQRHLNMLVRQR
jgi:hypothetical protein